MAASSFRRKKTYMAAHDGLSQIPRTAGYYYSPYCSLYAETADAIGSSGKEEHFSSVFLILLSGAVGSSKLLTHNHRSFVEELRQTIRVQTEPFFSYPLFELVEVCFEPSATPTFFNFGPRDDESETANVRRD
ncbi:hypothetical protein A0H81_00532 [Grifola frondosa]|uniref:Uncharacterized protein n=1 Tax=Grifola frondosa TaxID=5627 RepID=A0A1C7MQ80_GRIFR|nr:hypothetical protein A0H81_00532 [Grifola frondosa]